MAISIITNLLRQAMGTDRHCHRQNCGHSNGDSSNEKNQQIVNPGAVWPVLNWVHDNNLYDHPHGNGTNAEIPNSSQDLFSQNKKGNTNYKVLWIESGKILFLPIYKIQYFHLLKVTLLVGGVHEVSCLAKEGMNTSGNNHCFNLSLFAC